MPLLVQKIIIVEHGQNYKPQIIFIAHQQREMYILGFMCWDDYTGWLYIFKKDLFSC